MKREGGGDSILSKLYSTIRTLPCERGKIKEEKSNALPHAFQSPATGEDSRLCLFLTFHTNGRGRGKIRKVVHTSQNTYLLQGERGSRDDRKRILTHYVWGREKGKEKGEGKVRALFSPRWGRKLQCISGHLLSPTEKKEKGRKGREGGRFRRVCRRGGTSSIARRIPSGLGRKQKKRERKIGEE